MWGGGIQQCISEVCRNGWEWGGGHINNAYRKYRRRESNTVTQQETNVDYRLKVMLFQFKDVTLIMLVKI